MATPARGERRAPKAVPRAAALELAHQIEELHTKLAHLLDEFVEADKRECPQIPVGVLRGLRTARHCYGFCACNWLRDEAK
jgi:hypothetical protein